MVECHTPEEESKAGATAASEGSSAVSHDQDVPKESITTSSPDTDSPVMINVDVSVRLKMLKKHAQDICIFFLSDLNKNSVLLFTITLDICCVLILFILLMQEMGSGNTSQKSDEEDFVKVDDLPLQLTVMCEVCNSSHIN